MFHPAHTYFIQTLSISLILIFPSLHVGTARACICMCILILFTYSTFAKLSLNAKL